MILEVDDDYKRGYDHATTGIKNDDLKYLSESYKQGYHQGLKHLVLWASMDLQNFERDYR